MDHPGRARAATNTASSASTPAASQGWLALLLALVLAFAWQNGIVQGHFHSYESETALSYGQGHPGAQLTTPPRAPHKAPVSCPLCRELAHAGQLLATDTIVIDAAAVAAIDPAPTTIWSGRGPQRSHAWYSRGPPVSA